MSYLKLKRAVWAAVAAGAFAATAAPTDNLRTEYRNDVHPYDDGAYDVDPAVQLGAGSGYFFTTNRAIRTRIGSFTLDTQLDLDDKMKWVFRTPNIRSTVGAPIAAMTANKFLGEKITPPEDWTGEEPVIDEETGGKAVWVDFAEEVIACEAGPIRISWPLKDGGTRVEQSVVAASPNKRPVRLYWTHQRPYLEGGAEVSKILQNGGPTVTFSQNYKVHLYPTSRIHVYDKHAYDKYDGEPPAGVETYMDKQYGYVELDGTELKAYEGSYGTFLLVYSRLDEATNKRSMLAYELVEVLEPKQTKIDVKIGDQLKPQTRDFATNELFPRVTRGLTDESENDEIYVYQHSSGKQKNYLWAIRDSSENPWKIEVFWRAKEELDVVWPFEVDIYAASWDEAGAQTYVRDTENEEGGEAKKEPVVYYPESLGVEAMPYQVSFDSNTGKSIEKEHFHVSGGVMYSDWADDGTYALLKYASGDSVWFQTVRSVPAKNETLLTELGLDIYSISTNKSMITGSFSEDELEWGIDIHDRVAIAKEIRAPFAGEDGFFYPGWIRTERELSEYAMYPVKNPYNADLYDYPTSYMPTNEFRSQIFPVNVGELEVWWSLPSKLMSEARPNGGNGEKLNAQVYFPSIPLLYTVYPPEAIAYEIDSDTKTPPQIVLASGKGSAGMALGDHLPYYEGKVSTLFFEPGFWMDSSHPYTGAVVKLAGMGNSAGTVSNFTFEARLTHAAIWDTQWVQEIPVVSFYRQLEDGSVDANAYLTIGVDDAGNLYLNKQRKTSWSGGTNETEDLLFPNRFAEYSIVDESEDSSMGGGMHIALVHTDDGVWRYYLNGHLAWQGTDGACGIDVSGDTANLFESYINSAGYCGAYTGLIHYLRLWSDARNVKELDQNRYQQCSATDDLVFQYYGPTQEFETYGVEDVLRGPVKNGYLTDSSGHGAHAYLGYSSGEMLGEDTSEWMTAGEQRQGFLRIPSPGQTFPADATIYRQNDPEKDGYNPNEEHAFLVGGVAYALRCDLNRIDPDEEGEKAFTSLPYVLVAYNDPDNAGKKKMSALRVVPENDMYRFCQYKDAGTMIQSPDPLARLQPANLQKFMSGPLYGDTDTCFKDRKGWYWAHQAGNDGGSTNYVFELSYPNQDGFDWPDGNAHAAGEIVPWMANYERRDDTYLWRGFFSFDALFPARAASDPVGTAIDYTYIVDWPLNAPKLYVNDTLHDAKDGLPAIRGQLSAKVLYQQSMMLSSNESVRLIDPEVRRGGALIEIPADIRNYRDPKTAKRKFTDLPPLLRDRFQWNPTAFYDRTNDDTRELELTGQYIKDGNYAFTLLNVMDERSKAVMLDPDLLPGAEHPDWVKGIESMSGEAYVLPDDLTPFDQMALATTGRGAGYVTLVFNNSTNLTMVSPSEVISMYVIKVVPELYNGYLHVMQSDNPLDKQLNMKYTSDFGGRPQDWEFEWQYCEPVNGSAALDDNGWLSLAGSCGKPGVPMLDWITVGDAGVFGLSDHYVRCRYRSLDPAVQALVGTQWSNWSAPKLAEGWIKRVLKAINPFDQKIRDFLNNEIDVKLSVLEQAGEPYDGDIPLNLEALNESGLIAIYETVLNQAKKLSINDEKVATESLALSLQMAAGRIAELYTALGNEAMADALNPTVDLGSGSGVDDSADSSIFPFMNQCENILEEELCLLRGRDMSAKYKTSWQNAILPWEAPFYNRLAWNFTADIMGGQVAYVENYGIRDKCGASDAADPSKPDGVIDVYDAKKLYPQGHGDAWGHYLSAVKGYYTLLRHPNFGWKPQIEGILAGQTEITIGNLHEKRFAQAAEAKARAGEKIVADTFRWNYRVGAQDAWLDAEDETVWEDDAGGTCTRAWGTDEWATRAHLGAYYDWAVANSLLPSRTSDELGLIRMLDRESTFEIGAIAASARKIQSTADYADTGLNPLGLSDNAIPFDISPSEIDAGKTHFEQIMDRARRATKVAKDVFNRVKSAANRLRDQNASGDFENMVSDEEAAIERRLIEIYGYPYDDDIGPGKTYPQGYSGPDIYHYYYVETYDLDGSGGINGEYRGVQAGDGSYGRYIDVTVDDYSLITTNVTGTFQAERDESLADNGFFGNIIVGAVSWYQDQLEKVGSYIDPWSKYTGVCSTNYALPVAVVDTDGDLLDGKIAYEFSVAAWSNTPWVASYYVGESGFTPKPKDFHGQRKAEGEVQIALNGYAALLAEIDVKANKLLAANEKLQGLIDELSALDYTTQMGYVTEAAKKEIENYIAACKKNAETVKTTLEAIKQFKDTLTESGVEAFPKITGLSFDLTSIGRAALLALKSGVNDLIHGEINLQDMKIKQAEEAINEIEVAMNKQFAAWMDNEERKKKIAAIKEQTANVKSALGELEIAYNNANDKRMRYAKIVAEGDELQAERERLRIQWAADLSQSRYRNMMYQIMRNDELQRYNEAFELAARYTFLAAKAYDYETGMLQSDSSNAAGSEFMEQIVRARALGRFTSDGQPLGGGSTGDPGLADILFRMEENWSVLRSRLGFNNAQNDLDAFSLRRDLCRIVNNDDEAWKTALANYWVDDLRTHPAFQQLCQPFNPMKATEPGFAIPFRTVIASRKDLFGNDLEGGSTAYSSTYFATKLRGVGVWIEGENALSALPKRPEVYLVPTGLDYMRVPISSGSASSATRAWQVVDQVLPVPYALADSDWEATDWSALKDICSNALCVQRRHPAIRANVGASFDEASTLVYNSRLIGRSVWNSEWWVLIPAASLNADSNTGKNAFLDNVKDIHLYLKTYSFSGN